MKHEISCVWQKDMVFEAEIDGHKLKLDASPQYGGNNAGPRPKPLLLAGLAGCTGMDVVSILEKMKISLTYFNLRVSGELAVDDPKYYREIHLVYEFKGENVPLERIKHAVELSLEKYCGVRASLSPKCKLTYEIKIL